MSHVDPFNALGGFSVGIPPELVIDENGNVVNNVNAPNSNVTANRVFANAYFYANGNPLSIGASGSNTQVQYNNNGLLGASSAFTFNSATNLLTVTNLQVGNRANLGTVGNVVILGGTNGYFLQTDGTGNLSWAPAGNGGNTGNGVPGGANTQVQFNDAGNFAGDAGFTYNKNTNVLTVTDINAGNISADYIVLNWDVTANVVYANYLHGDGSNVTNVSAVVASTANSVAGANVTGQVNFAAVANSVAGANVTGQVNYANIANNVAGANVSGQVGNALVAGTVYNAAQPLITSVGNLTSLTVIGNTTLGNQVTANYFVGNLFGVANLARNVTLASQPNITSVGTLTSLTVSGNTTLGNATTSNYFIGNLYGVANSAVIANTANVATLANNANQANTANLAGTVSVNAQPNITSVGTLTNLVVSGNVTASNFIGNFVGDISNANYANFAGEVTNSAQPNITSVGTLSSLSVSGIITTNSMIGGLRTNAQPNITSVGTLTGLTINGVADLGNVGNIKINGGNNGFVLSTDGAGNLSWVSQSGNGGNGVPGGTNTQVQFNNQGAFDGSVAFTWNNASNVLTVGGNIQASNRITSTSLVVSNSATIQALTVAGNIASNNLTVTNNVSANLITGTLTTNAQPNINYLGNIGWLNVNTSVPNSNGNITFNGIMRGTGAASDIIITGNVDAGNYVQANLLIGALTTSAQPNITSLGNLTSLNVVGLSNLGNVGNVTILGGSNGYVLSTDGAGNLSWKVDAANGGTTPGGLNTYIQFNDGNTFGGDNAFTWNKVTNYLFVGGNANFSGTVNAQVLTSNVSTGSPPLVVNSTTPVANLGVQTADTVRNSAQPNITSVGTLGNLTVSGTGIFTSNLSVANTFSAGNITTDHTIGTTNLNVTGNANFSANATVSGSGTLAINGKLNTAGASNVWIGNIANFHISGGINGYVLATDGNANLYWTAGGGGGGNGTPGGSNTQIQYNNAGAFAGSPVFTFDAPNSEVRIAGNLQVNTFVMGSGIYEFSSSNVFFATTTSTATQTILAIDANDIAAVDYTIISTDGSIRNFIKISAVLCDGSLSYVEYSTLPVGGYTGDFVVGYDGGNIITPPTIQLILTPQSANVMTHKMSVTTYKE